MIPYADLIRNTYQGFRSFPFFNQYIFPIGSVEWEKGQYIESPHTNVWAEELQQNKFTARMCARKHLKSTTFYSHVMWKILRSQGESFEGLYLSYTAPLAAYHTAKIKERIQRNPYFKDIVDLTDASGYLEYTWDDHKNRISIAPEGALSFKRGRHPDICWCDDILADPKSVLNVGTVQQITRAFKEEIISLPKEHTGELHLAGTPQSLDDVFFQIEKINKEMGEQKQFFFKREPAILNELEQKVVWEKMFPYERLQILKRTMGNRSFLKEYMCSPSRVEDSYIKWEELKPCVKESLKNLNQLNTENDVVGGWDLGKKRHPSHFTVFESVNGHKIQVYQEFWDGVDYDIQLGRVKKWKERLLIDRVYFDATRGEFELEEERGKLPSWLSPITFTTKSKGSMAKALEKNVREKTVEFINDQRMLNQMLIVDNNLQASETDEGHADSFWSIALALSGFEREKDNPFYLMIEDETTVT